MRSALLILLAVGCVASQQNESAFLGTWKGVCADGQDFVIVTLTRANGRQGASLEGTIRLANMRGGDDGQCVAVVDPPSDKHALAVTGAKLQGSTLTFQGSKRMEFEMTLPGKGAARLKLLGTASEDNPWTLRLAR